MKIAADLHFPMRDAAQPMVHLEAAVMQMATLEPGETLAQLLQRLEALEQRLAGGASSVGMKNAQATSTSIPSGAKPPMPAGGSRGEREPGMAERAEAERAGAGGGGERPPKGIGGEAPTARKEQPVSVVREVIAASATTAVIDDDLPRLDSEIEEKWRTVVETINARKRMLGAFLQESRMVGVTSGALLLAMDALHRSVVDEHDNRGMVEQVMADTFKTPLKLSCVPETTAAERPRAADLKPLVDRAIAWFEGDLIQPSGDAGRSSS